MTGSGARTASTRYMQRHVQVCIVFIVVVAHAVLASSSAGLFGDAVRCIVHKTGSMTILLVAVAAIHVVPPAAKLKGWVYQ